MHPNWGKEVKLSLFADGIIIYIEIIIIYIYIYICTIYKTIRTVRATAFSKAAGYNTKKSVAFLYTNNELLERESKKINSFKIASQRIKSLGINNQGGKRPTL